MASRKFRATPVACSIFLLGSTILTTAFVQQGSRLSDQVMSLSSLEMFKKAVVHGILIVSWINSVIPLILLQCGSQL